MVDYSRTYRFQTEIAHFVADGVIELICRDLVNSIPKDDTDNDHSMLATVTSATLGQNQQFFPGTPRNNL